MPDSSTVSDTSPLQYLYQANQLDLLREIYGSVTAPEAVLAEIKVGRSQGVALPDLRAFGWIEIVEAPHLEILPLVVDLGPGEREVLSLAVSRPESLALLDDALARHFAEVLQVRFTGTLGVLLKAKQLNLIEEVRPTLDELQNLGFRLDSGTRAAVLKLAGEPKSNATGS